MKLASSLSLALALALCGSTAHAQPTSRLIAGGWTLHEHIGTITGVEDVACSERLAAARSWSGDTAVFDGASWTTVPRDRSQSRYGRTLAVAPDGAIFLESGGGLARFDGTRWEQLDIPSWEGDVDAQIVAPGASEVYYVGRGRIARYDGRSITAYDGGTYRQISAVAAFGRTILVGGQGGTILRHDGASWSRETTGVDHWIRGLVALAADDIWAWAEDRGREPIVLHWDGRVWARRDTGLTAAVTALGGAPGHLYATGDFGIARFDGAVWAVVLSSAELAPGYHAPHGACATATHIVIGDRGGGAITRPR
jgi:hypothetical protein